MWPQFGKTGLHAFPAGRWCARVRAQPGSFNPGPSPPEISYLRHYACADQQDTAVGPPPSGIRGKLSAPQDVSVLGMNVIPAEVVTPAILIDVDVLDRNIERMASSMLSRGLRLRPHVKTHKTLEIARKQLAAGAEGITVATIGEAEVFAADGVTDIFIAYPLWVDAPRAERLRALAASCRVAVGLDSAESATAMGHQMGVDARRIEVLVEIDSGHHRSGVLPDEAVDVARAAAEAGLTVAGVFTFPGHSYKPGMPTGAASNENEALGLAAEALMRAGFEISTISGDQRQRPLSPGKPWLRSCAPASTCSATRSNWNWNAAAGTTLP